MMHIRMQIFNRNLELYNRWQILSSFFVDMRPQMRPALTILTLKWNDKVCSGSTQPHPQWSSFERSHRPQGYDVCILGQRRSSDDWLLVARQECCRCILHLISPQTAWSSQRKTLRKVNTLGAASQRQCTNAHLPCCHGRCAWVRLRTPLNHLIVHPSDFQLSRYLKESLRGRAFEDDEAVIMAINEWIE